MGIIPEETEVEVTSIVIPVTADGYDYDKLETMDCRDTMPPLHSVRKEDSSFFDITRYKEDSEENSKSFSGRQMTHRIREMFKRYRRTGVNFLEDGESPTPMKDFMFGDASLVA